MRGGGRTWSGDDRGRSASSRPATCSTGCCRRSRAARRADPSMLDVPVLLIVYRRPDLAARVLDTIAAARPRRLFVAADGPRSAAEREGCDLAGTGPPAATWPPGVPPGL